MLENLKLQQGYDGFLFLAAAELNPPILASHHHVELELNLVVQGSISYVVEGRRYTFQRGTLLWMFPTQEHQLVDRSNDAKYYVAVFKPSLIRRACRGKNYAGLKRKTLSGDGVLHKILNLPTFEYIRATMDWLMRDSLDDSLLNKEAGFGINSNFSFSHGDLDALNGGLHYLLVLAWRSFLAEEKIHHPYELHPSIAKALSLLGKPGESLTAGRLATRCGLSEAHLSRLFHEQVGVPINRYRNSVRLGQFMELYRQPGQRTILECVYEAGFGSYSQFFKIFRQSCGYSPRKFLKQ